MTAAFRINCLNKKSGNRVEDFCIMKNTFFLLCFSLLLLPARAAEEPTPPEEPNEHLYGEPVFFRQDGFRDGNYRDYFQRTFNGRLVYNREGREGAMAFLHTAVSRPFRVEGGRKYALTMEMFNLGAGNGSGSGRDDAAAFPGSVLFLTKGGKAAGAVRGNGPAGAEPLPGQWKEISLALEAPANAMTMCFRIGSAEEKGFGPYLVRNVRLTERSAEP